MIQFLLLGGNQHKQSDSLAVALSRTKQGRYRRVYQILHRDGP